MIKFPDVTVQLAGENGDAFAIVARTRRAMLDGGVPRYAIEEFMAAAPNCGSYDGLLALVASTVTVA